MPLKLSINKKSVGLKNLPSFTIIEILVAMALSSIVIGSGALLYLRFNGYLSDAMKKSRTENSAILFYQAFKNDINQAENILTATDEVTINSATKGIISYFFTEDYILRQQEEIIDTFIFKVNDLTIAIHPVSGKFNYLEAKLNSGVAEYPVFILKNYQNAEMFNQEN